MKNSSFILVSFLFLVSILFVSCIKSNDNEEALSAYVDIYVQNNNGENLLGDKYKAENIKLYYLIDNKLSEVYDPNLSAPRNYSFVDIENHTAIRIYPYVSNDELYTTTVVEWNEYDMDTIKCFYYRNEDNSFVRLDTVWFNGVKMIPNHIYGPTRGFKIVK